MSSVTALREMQKGRAPAGYLWCRSTILADGIDTVYSRLTNLCEILSRQLDSVDRLLAALPDATRQAQLVELAGISRLMLLEADRLLAQEHARLADMRQQRFHIYGRAGEPSDRSWTPADPDGTKR